MSDPLAAWWRHPVTVKRWQGEGAYGPVYDTPTIESGYISGRTRMVRDKTGAEVVSSATIALPRDTPPIQPGSLVTLPPSHGGRTALVLTVAVGDGGGQPTPDHIELGIE